MKKSHIALIIALAVVCGMIVFTYAKAVDSSTFSEASSKPGKQVKITGLFDKTVPVEYNELKDPNLTVFNVVDAEGVSRKVYLHDKSGRPMGLEMSESVTIEGKIGDDGNFHASHLLMKCPSKYNEQKHSLAGEK